MIARSYCHFRASPEAEIGQGTGDRYIVSMPAAKVLGQPFHHAISWTPQNTAHTVPQPFISALCLRYSMANARKHGSK